MAEPAAPTSPLRSLDAALLGGSLLAVVALAWFYLYLLAADMAAMDMTSAAAMRPWRAVDFILMFVMWAVMMVGMMVPTAVRAVLIYARLASQAQARGSPVAATWSFILGYLLVWTGFSLLAASLQGVLTSLGLLSAMMASASPYLGAGLLLLAGAYQFSPLKDSCLRHCQSPALFMAGRFGPRLGAGIRLGLHHGAYCLGCCWLLMALLFLGGVMNLIWIASITAFVLLEKLLAPRFRLSGVSGALMLAAGLVYLLLTVIQAS